MAPSIKEEQYQENKNSNTNFNLLKTVIQFSFKVRYFFLRYFLLKYSENENHDVIILWTTRIYSIENLSSFHIDIVGFVLVISPGWKKCIGFS